MPQVAIEKCKTSEDIPQTLLEHIQGISDSIRQRAFNLFQNRNAENGSDLDDWLQAERDIVWSPASELMDSGDELKARIALPGFDARDVQVSATPDALVVQADSKHSHEGQGDNVYFCEFSGKQLFRRLALPTEIDVEKVKASLDKGILEIVAPKAVGKQMTAGA